MSWVRRLEGGKGRGRRERAMMFAIPISRDSVVLGLAACRQGRRGA